MADVNQRTWGIDMGNNLELILLFGGGYHRYQQNLTQSATGDFGEGEWDVCGSYNRVSKP